MAYATNQNQSKINRVFLAGFFHIHISLLTAFLNKKGKLKN